MTATSTPPAKADKFQTVTTGGNMAAATIVANALIAWFGGTAAWHGFHVSLPFLATLIALIALDLLVIAVVHLTAFHWHSVKADFAAEIASKGRLAEGLAEKFLEENAGKAFTEIVSQVKP